MEIKENVHTIESKFWSHVKKLGIDECWEWGSQRNSRGYGIMYLSRKAYLAHRISMLIHNGKMPDNLALHKCNNPPCVNPRHLKDGSPRENMMDKEINQMENMLFYQMSDKDLSSEHILLRQDMKRETKTKETKSKTINIRLSEDQKRKVVRLSKIYFGGNASHMIIFLLRRAAKRENIEIP